MVLSNKVFAICLILFLFITFPKATIFAAGIDINSASLEELDQITSVGPTIAQRIIDGRPFSSLDDLLRIKGIGDKTLQKIKDQGLAYVSGNNQITTQAQNSVTPTPAPAPTPQPTSNITYPGGIIINEFLPSPEGPDETDEWIEFYNKNSSDVNLEGWKIQDTQGTTTAYIFPKNTVIKSNGFFTLKRPDSHIILNNQQDGLQLLQPNGNIVDSVSYVNAPKAQSYNYTSDDWQWSSNFTPDSKNVTVVATEVKPTAKTQTKTITTLPETQKTDNKYLSAISESLPQIQNTPSQENKEASLNSWWLFFGAAALIAIIAAIILILKFKFFNNDVRS